MNRIRQALFLAIGFTIALLFALLALELAFGSWIRQDKWEQTRSLNIIRNQTIAYGVGNVHGHENPQVSYSRDRFGLRGSCTDPQNISILTLGGSTTDQRLISDGGTWQDILQSELRKAMQEPICVANAGVDGHSTFGHFYSFQAWFPLIDKLSPKTYLLYIGINDAGFRLSPAIHYDTQNPNDISVPTRSFWEKSALYQLFRSSGLVFASLRNAPIQAYAGHAKRPPNDADYTATATTAGVDELIQINTAAFEIRLNQIIDEISRRNADFACISQPHLFAKLIAGTYRGVENAFEYQGRVYNGLDFAKSIAALNAAMRKICTARSGSYIDIASKHFERDDFYDFVHNTPRGSDRLGRYMFEELQRANVIRSQANIAQQHRR